MNGSCECVECEAADGRQGVICKLRGSVPGLTKSYLKYQQITKR